jgi:hypothetical protein
MKLAAVPAAGSTKMTSAGSRRGVSTEKKTTGLSRKKAQL